MAETLQIIVDAQTKGSDKVKSLGGDLKGLGAAGNTAAPGLDKAAKSAGMLEGAVGKLAAAGALAAVGKVLVDFGKASIAAASDAEEAASKFAFVFGPAAESTGASLDQFAEAANRSRFELRAMAADVGAMTEATLGSKAAAGEMSVAVAKLAVDLASFNNVTEEEALTALKAGLIGEAEPMRKFGVLLSATAVDARVLADGMANTKSEITDAMRVQARFNIMMEQTATAQGDAIRTSDSYVNQQRALQAATEELSVTIGQSLLPAATKATTALAAMVKSLNENATAQASLDEAYKSGIISYGEWFRLSHQVRAGTLSAAEASDILNQEMIALTAATEMSAAEMGAWEGRAARAAQMAEAAAKAVNSYTEQYRLNAAVANDAGQATDAYEVSAEQVAEAEKRRAEAHEEAIKAQQDAAQAARDHAAAMGDYFTRAVEATDASGDLANNQEAVNRALYDAADASGASAEQLAILGGALGLYSEEAVEAALKTALIQEKINQLAQEYIAGNISVGQMNLTLNNFIASLNSTTGATDSAATGIGGIGGQAVTTAAEVEELTQSLNRVPSEVGAKINVDASAAESNLERIRQLLAAIAGGGVNVDAPTAGVPRQHGGPVSARVPYLVGEAGPEIFVPNSSGMIIPNNQINSGNVSLSVAVYPQSNQPAAIARSTADEVQRRLREAGIVGLRG